MEPFTWEEIKSNNLIVIKGLVYNLQEYKNKHPGGAYIIDKYLGKDATSIFFAVRHSNHAIEEMKKFIVGRLVDES